MKLLKYLFISVLVVGMALMSSPAKSQTPPRLPMDLSAALCKNNWDQALTLTQQRLSSSTLSPAESSQLATLSTQISDDQRAGTPIDQSKGCETAMSPFQRSSSMSAQSTSDKPSVISEAAQKRHRRSVEEGDYRL